MTVEASTESGWDGACVGLELSVERLKSWVRGLPMDICEHFILEVIFFETWDAGRKHG